jgi:hypothetical protein
MKNGRQALKARNRWLWQNPGRGMRWAAAGWGMALAICPRRVSQKSRLVHHFNLLDWDGNGCSELADL